MEAKKKTSPRKTSSHSAKAKPSPSVLEDEEEKPMERALVTYADRSDSTIVYKGNELVRNAIYNLSLAQQRFMLKLFAMILREDTSLPKYELTYYEIAKMIGLNPHSGRTYEMIEANIKALHTTEIGWVRLSGTNIKKHVTWISQLYNDESNNKMIIELDDVLKPLLLNLTGNYTMFDMAYTMPMRSQYSVRLYELCKSWQNYHEKILWDVDNLKQQLACSYNSWTDFERFVLKKAKEEINKYTDITFDYKIAKKVKRKVVSIAVVVAAKTEEEMQSIDDAISPDGPKMKKSTFDKLIKSEKVESDTDDDEIVAPYQATANGTIECAAGADHARMVDELHLRMDYGNLSKSVSKAQRQALDIVVDTLATMAGAGTKKADLENGGNKKFFAKLNEIIIINDGLRPWIVALMPKYETIIRTKIAKLANPAAYLKKSLANDMEEFRVIIAKANAAADPAVPHNIIAGSVLEGGTAQKKAYDLDLDDEDEPKGKKKSFM